MGRAIVSIRRAEKACSARPLDDTCLSLYNASGVVAIGFGMVEVNSPHGILDVELVLHFERNLLRATDNQEEIWELSGIDRARADMVTAEKFQG